MPIMIITVLEMSSVLVCCAVCSITNRHHFHVEQSASGLLCLVGHISMFVCVRESGRAVR